MTSRKTDTLSVVAVEQRIFIIRGQRVILDADLALLYAVDTKRLNEQVKRNRERFPADFMFQLTAEELELLRSQIATTSISMRRNPPYAFTEHGAIQAANVVNSQRAVEVGVLVVRAFVRLRQLAGEKAELSLQLRDIQAQLRELRDESHDHGVQIDAIMETLDELMKPAPLTQQRQIGF